MTASITTTTGTMDTTSAMPFPMRARRRSRRSTADYACAYNDANNQCLAYNPSCIVSCGFLYYQ